MTTTCESCGHQFTNIFLRSDCPRCGQSIKRSSVQPASTTYHGTVPPDGFDSTGFAIGMMTGVPISPTYGISTGSILGAALHSNPSHAAPAPAAPEPAPSPSCDTPSSLSSSYDSSSSSCSYDSGSSSSSSFDSGF